MISVRLHRKRIGLIAVFMILLFASLAFAGVGGGIEAKEKVDIVPLVK